MIRVEVITPERIVYEGEGQLVIIPTTNGILGVGAGHIPLLAPLKAGEVIIRKPKGDEFMAVAGGFVEISGTLIRILADSAEHAEEINEAAVKQAIAEAERAKENAKNDVQFTQASALIEHNLARLKVAQRRHSRGGGRGITNQDGIS